MQVAKKIIDTLQNNLQTKMTERKISAAELGRNAGLNESAVRNILNGKSNNPGIESLSAIANSLGCSIDELVGQDELDKLKPASSDIPRSTTREITIWDADLYQACTIAVESYLKDRSYKPNGEQILFFIKEAYLYAIKVNDSKPDTKFIHWLLDNYC